MTTGEVACPCYIGGPRGQWHERLLPSCMHLCLLFVARAAALLLPACSLSLPLLLFPLLRFFASRMFLFSLCNWMMRTVPVRRVVPATRLSSVRASRTTVLPLRQAPATPSRVLSPPPSLCPLVLSACSPLARSPTGLLPIQASETLVCGAASRPPALPLRPTQFLSFQFLSRVWAPWTCRPTGLSCDRLIDRASEPVWRSRPEHMFSLLSPSPWPPPPSSLLPRLPSHACAPIDATAFRRHSELDPFLFMSLSLFLCIFI